MDSEEIITHTGEWRKFILLLKETYYPNTPFVDICKLIRKEFNISQVDIREGTCFLNEIIFLAKVDNPLAEEPKQFAIAKCKGMKRYAAYF